MDQFTRFTLLRALWARARTLLAWLGMPHAREAQHRAHRWQQMQVAERLIREGALRRSWDPESAVRAQRWHQIQTTDRQLRKGVPLDAGDPDSDVRPPAPDYPEAWALQGQAQFEAQRLAYEAWQRQGQQQQQTQQQRRR